MPSRTPTRVLIVAHQTADSPELIQTVAKRAARGPCRFTLLVPASARGLHRVVDPADRGSADAERRLEAALPLLSQAAGQDVVGVVGNHDPLTAVHDALHLLGFDEVIVSMLPARLSRWQRSDLPNRIRARGVPVIEVLQRDSGGTPVPAA